MVVVVGDQQEGGDEDVILIPEQEGDHEIRKTKNVSCLSGVPLILTGNLIFGICVSRTDGYSPKYYSMFIFHKLRPLMLLLFLDIYLDNNPCLLE